MPDEATVKCIWQSIATFLGGGFVGSLLGHFLAVGRDKRNQTHADEYARQLRLSEFKGYLSGFRSWVERSSDKDRGDGFHAQVNEFRRETGRIRDDVPIFKWEKFDAAVESLCRLTASQVAYSAVEGNDVNEIGKNRLASAIDAVSKTLIQTS